MGTREPTGDRRPNVVLVHCHDMGQYLGCYGADVETPTIDRIAEEGARFSEYFCTAPQCCPSRSSIATGKYPHRNGMLGQTSLGWGLHDDEVTIASALTDLGYETVTAGIHHISNDPTTVGFQRELKTETRRAREISAAAIDLLESRSADDPPLFLSLGFHETHRPYNERDTVGESNVDLSRYVAADPESVSPLPYLPDGPGVRQDLADLHGRVRAVDEGVAAIDDALGRLDLREETLFVFTTDHGLPFPRAKGMCYDPGLETALVIRWPGVVDAGRVVEDLVSNVDFMPTILDLVGASAPPGIDGRSTRPALRGQEYDAREQLFFEITWHGQYNPIRGVRTKQYKYLHNFWMLPLVYVPGTQIASHAGSNMPVEFLASRRPEEELYDLRADPNEQRNLAREDEYADLLASFREDVDEWMRATDDPLLDGPVAPPVIREFSIHDGYRD